MLGARGEDLRAPAENQDELRVESRTLSVLVHGPDVH